MLKEGIWFHILGEQRFWIIFSTMCQATTLFSCSLSQAP